MTIKDLAANSGVKTINWTNEVWTSSNVASAKITKIVITFADGTKETIFSGEVSVRGMYGYIS